MRELHAALSKALPKLKASMSGSMIAYGKYHYKYASGREGDAAMVALASQKSYISIYLCGADDGQYLPEKHKSEMPKANIGKGCIRIKQPADLDLKLLARLAKRSAQLLASQAVTETA